MTCVTLQEHSDLRRGQHRHALMLPQDNKLSLFCKLCKPETCHCDLQQETLRKLLTAAAIANPEEIQLDAADDQVYAEQDAEAAKQEMAEDNSMFQSETLHNYSGGILPEDGFAGSAKSQTAAISPAYKLPLTQMNEDQNDCMSAI